MATWRSPGALPLRGPKKSEFFLTRCLLPESYNIFKGSDSEAQFAKIARGLRGSQSDAARYPFNLLGNSSELTLYFLVMFIGTKYPTKVENYAKSCTTLVMCCSANGVLLPPYVIYKSDHLFDKWAEGGPVQSPCCTDECCKGGARYNRSKSGWMDAMIYQDWFFHLFLPHASRLQGKVVLLCDNLSSHFSPDIIAECQKRNISFVCMLPNSTHLCQPLDVSVFASFKTAWRETLGKFRRENPVLTVVPKAKFAKLLKATLLCMDTITIRNNVLKDRIRTIIISGFKTCGYYPLDRNQVLKKLPGYQEPEANTTDESLNTTNTSGNFEKLQDKLVDFLRTKRYPDAANNKSTQPKRRCKRVKVVPGRSITVGGELFSAYVCTYLVGTYIFYPFVSQIGTYLGTHFFSPP